LTFSLFTFKHVSYLRYLSSDWIAGLICYCVPKKRKTGNVEALPITISVANANSRFVGFSREISTNNAFHPNLKELQEAQEEENRRSLRASFMKSRFGGNRSVGDYSPSTLPPGGPPSADIQYAYPKTSRY
jgi:hypothetical protein